MGFPPKSSILIGFSIINHPFWGTTIFGNTHILGGGGFIHLDNFYTYSRVKWSNLTSIFFQMGWNYQLVKYVHRYGIDNGFMLLGRMQDWIWTDEIWLWYVNVPRQRVAKTYVLSVCEWQCLAYDSSHHLLKPANLCFGGEFHQLLRKDNMDTSRASLQGNYSDQLPAGWSSHPNGAPKGRWP